VTAAPGVVPDAAGSAAPDPAGADEASTRPAHRRWLYVLIAVAAVIVIVLAVIFLPDLVTVYPAPGK
jgi:hypothetical protein